MLKFDKSSFLEIMKMRGINSQLEFSKMSNISQAQIVNILNNKHSPTLKTLDRICRLLKCEISDIIITS
tara:strand:- start:128 stop:334 length:207 start_codon:yes stop_codon:yes gene_type:complete